MYVPPASHLAKIQSTKQFGWQNFRKTVSKFKETPHQPQSLSTGQQKYDRRKLIVSCWVWMQHLCKVKTSSRKLGFDRFSLCESLRHVRALAWAPRGNAWGLGYLCQRSRGIGGGKPAKNTVLWAWWGQGCSKFFYRGFKYDGNDFSGFW